MKEPYLSQFTQLINQGAAARDIHDSTGIGSFDTDLSTVVSDRFLQRELGRVEQHERSLCAPLVDQIGTASRILDVGCGTGGTTVALALSNLGAEQVVGVDASAATLEAARVRASSYDLLPEQVRFEHVPAGQRLPFPDATFDLVTCVSVLEFIASDEARRFLVSEFLRVVRPGGHVFLATPSPFRLREFHSRRPLGDWRPAAGYPWSSPPWSVRKMFAGNELVSLARHRIRRQPRLKPLAWAAPILQWAFPWQQFLVRKRMDTTPGQAQGPLHSREEVSASMTSSTG